MTQNNRRHLNNITQSTVFVKVKHTNKHGHETLNIYTNNDLERVFHLMQCLWIPPYSPIRHVSRKAVFEYRNIVKRTNTTVYN